MSIYKTINHNNCPSEEDRLDATTPRRTTSQESIKSIGGSMNEPVFINGRAKLDYCYQCQEYKEAIKHSQSIKDPIYCVLMSDATEGSPAEAYAEYDRHKFVITESQYKADIEAERRWFESFGGQL